MSPLAPDQATASRPLRNGQPTEGGAIGRHGHGGRALDSNLAHDLEGRIVLPGLVEPHAHLDKALTGDLVSNLDGDLDGAIAAWLPYRETLVTDDIRHRAEAAALRYLAHGTTLIRTHVDTGPGIGLRAIEALLAVRHDLAGLVDLQIVAAASNPVVGPDGTESRELLRAALDAGADLVGGGPWLADDPEDALEVLLEIGDETGRGVDLHLDETTDPAVLTLPSLVRHVAGGFRHPVTASHCVSLGSQPAEIRRRVAAQVAEAGIGIVSNPITSLYLQRRSTGHGIPRGLTAVRELLDAGVVVAAGGDNLRDPFNPLGRGDPLETVALLVTVAHLTIGEALAAVTAAARRLPGIGAGARSEGTRDLVAIAAASVNEAVAYASPDRVVIRDGTVVARTTLETTISHQPHRSVGTP